MNGPSHYREAERFIRIAVKAEEQLRTSDVDPTLRIRIINSAYARAQVHATLALAAAQVEDMESDALRPGWAEIVDEEGPQP